MKRLTQLLSASMVSPKRVLPILGLVLLVGVSLSQGWVESVSSSPSSAYAPPPLPPGRGAPGGRGGAGAASRTCLGEAAVLKGERSVIALVPTEKTPERADQGETVHVWGLTTAERPTFWFYVPYAKSSIQSIEFVLKSQTDQFSQTVYRAVLSAPEAPGIISVRLPSTVAPLAVGQPYNWFFKVRVACPKDPKPSKQDVEGWIQRVTLNPELGDRLKKETPQKQSILYAQNGIWYDALTVLAESRLKIPQDSTLRSEWTGLLKAVRLDGLAEQPLTPCCNPK